MFFNQTHFLPRRPKPNPLAPKMSSSSSESPFFNPQSTARANTLAILYLKRDLLLPTILQAHDSLHEGYSEGKVTNTRFGSYPHSTLIGKPWGTQVRASVVDTGSRGKRKKGGKKRKRRECEKEEEEGGEGGEEGEEVAGGGVFYQENGLGRGQEREQEEEQEGSEQKPKAAVVASTGFAHLLPPTPEIWTTSLPHRTQVVYTPDYSFILQRLRVTPGTVLIEAGAGSGSFTHAAARAVFNGYPERGALRVEDRPARQQKKCGRVWSYEFHEQRMNKLKEEITEHGLDGVVTITHKDVCEEGFGLDPTATSAVGANAVFLDLPAPWLALKHLTRAALVHPVTQNPEPKSTGDTSLASRETREHPSENSHHASRSQPLLDATSSVHLCTFSPCIEQVQRTITTMRQMGWLDIEMVEIAAKRIEVRRERVGLQEEGLRGVNASPATVDEAVARLREIESRSRIFHNEPVAGKVNEAGNHAVGLSEMSKQRRLEKIKEVQHGRKLYKEGRLVHKSEPDLKTHTSYLVFAILPRDWTAEDEQQARQR
jgi:tRNA (adenine57-N1/adenine58-N1)-methyltransferase